MTRLERPSLNNDTPPQEAFELDLTPAQREFLDRKSKLRYEAAEKGRLAYIGDGVLDNLRDKYYGGLPLSLIMLTNHNAVGKCYDYSVLLMHGLDENAKMVNANIKSLELWRGANMAGHSYVERDGWVYDMASSGLVIGKEYYDAIEQPEVFITRSYQECLEYGRGKFTSDELATAYARLEEVFGLVDDEYEIPPMVTGDYLVGDALIARDLIIPDLIRRKDSFAQPERFMQEVERYQTLLSQDERIQQALAKEAAQMAKDNGR